jgi:hypothetical protein
VTDPPLHSPPRTPSNVRRMHLLRHCSFLNRAKLAMQSSADAVQAANLTQAFSETNATLSPAITLQLAAQAALYIICCASLVLACVVAFIRLRQLNHALIESQKFVMQHQNKVRERASLQRKENLIARPSDCDDDCRRVTSAQTAGA